MVSCLAGVKRGDKRVPIGRPKKCEGGWKSANKRIWIGGIWIGNETFVRWHNLREKIGLANDDKVACSLLKAVEHEVQHPSLSTDLSVSDQLEHGRLISVV